MPLVMVSFKPPLSDIKTAHHLLDASKLVRPKGSCHLEQATAMLVFSSIFKTFLCFWKPNILRLLCLKINFSRGSSPITNACQSLCFFKIFNIEAPNKSYPFAEFNFPTNVIILSFFLKSILGLLVDWFITSSFELLQ